MSTIEENKRDVLLDLIYSFEDKYNEMVYLLENNHLDEDEKEVQKLIERANWLLKELVEHITYS